MNLQHPQLFENPGSHYMTKWGWLVFLIAIFISGCQSAEIPLGSMQISDHDYKEEFQLTEREPRPKTKRFYFWYKSQEVFKSQNNYAGLLLHGPYTKYYYSNELAEKGFLNNGLKSGKWTKWYRNGVVAEVKRWKNGRQHGKFIIRDSLGTITLMGNYKKGKENGIWINPLTADTIQYRNGRELKPKAKDSLKRLPLLKRLFAKGEDDLENKKEKERERELKKLKRKRKKANKKNVPRVSKKDSKKDKDKPNLFQRIFKKNVTKKEDGKNG